MDFAAHTSPDALDPCVTYAADTADHYHAMPRPSFILGVHDGNPAKRRKAVFEARRRRKERAEALYRPPAVRPRQHALWLLPGRELPVWVLLGVGLHRTVYVHARLCGTYDLSLSPSPDAPTLGAVPRGVGILVAAVAAAIEVSNETLETNG